MRFWPNRGRCFRFVERLIVLIAGLLICLSTTQGLRAAAAVTDPGVRGGAVATVHPIATEVARRIMQDGGNAVDGAVAAALTLGVVDGQNSGIGGGCFILIRTAAGRLVAIDGRETAPAAAHRDLFVKGGQADPKLSQTGPLSVGIPGALAAYDHAVRRYGRLPLRRHLEAAAEVAERGFAVQRTFALRLRQVLDEVKSDPGCRAILLNRSEAPIAEGEWLVQRDLSGTYRRIAETGTRYFYRGEFADRVGDWMRQQGGILSARDLARYRVARRQPVRTTYHGYEVVGFPPPSSGGVHVGQILNILERLDLRGKPRESAEWIHAVTEAMKLAFADRAFWLGDPDFTAVPRGLINKEYAATLARRIRLDRASVVPGPGEPPRAGEDVFGRHTTHLSTADREGNWVALTATINTTFGAKVVVPGTGVFLNNEMDDFVAAPGQKNFFGLVGGEANAVAPGKRPLSSMSPTLILKDGRPVLSVGAAGGPTIISQALLTILGVLDFGLSVEDSLKALRFHHQWSPDQLQLERTADPKLVGQLQAMGHTVQLVDPLGACQAIELRAQGFSAQHDPRVQGRADVW